MALRSDLRRSRSGLSRTLTLLCVPVLVAACAATTCPAGEQGEAPGRRTGRGSPPAESVATLRAAVEASYLRERDAAARIRQLEEENAALAQELLALRAQAAAPALPPSTATAPADDGGARERDAVPAASVEVVYQQGLALFNARRYDEALAAFSRVLTEAPQSEWADNAQYWRGECFYGLQNHRQALIEFTKVFVYPETEKADDAQLKAARCYAALGEQERALSAYQKLLDEYPDSEYAAAARSEMRQLRGR